MDEVDQLFPGAFNWGTDPSTIDTQPPSSSSTSYSFQANDANAAPVDDEPLYVNAKQYYRILKRRVARARLEEVHRLSRQRKVRRPLSRLSPFFTPRIRSRIFMNRAINMPCVGPEALVAASSPQRRLQRKKLLRTMQTALRT